MSFKTIMSQGNQQPSCFTRQPKDTAITLVCFAVKEEAVPFMRFVRGDPSVHVVITGMGERNAVRSLRSALDQRNIKQVWTCGFAGGLNPELSTGDVVFEEEMITEIGVVLEKIGAKRGHFFCSKRMVVTSAEKKALREETGAEAVDMESQHIHNICRERKIPCLTIRAISDTAKEELPIDFNQLLTEDDRINMAQLGLMLLKSPQKIPNLLALHRRTKQAASNLARVLLKLLRA